MHLSTSCKSCLTGNNLPEILVDGFFFLFHILCVGCINLSFAYVEGESLLMALKDVALSSGRYVEYMRKIVYF